MKRLWFLALVCACSSGDKVQHAPDSGGPDMRSLLQVAMAARSGLEPRFRAQFRADLGAAHARIQNAAQARVELAAALDEAKALTDPGDRDRVLTRIAQAMIALGDKAEARATAEKIGAADQRGEVLGLLAEDVAQAMAVPTPDDRDRALARLAIQDARSGNVDRAGQTVAKITNENLRPAVMGAITTGMLKAKRTIDATRLVGSLDGLSKSEGGAALAMDATARGDAKAARRWIKTIESELIRARTSAMQATLLPVGSPARKAASDEATRVALDIGSNDLRVASIEAVARVFADANDPVAAAAVLEAGINEPVRNRPGQTALDHASARRLRVLVAESWAATGAVDQASRLAEQVDDALLQAEAWAAVARAAATRGNIEPALAAVARIVPDELRLPVAADIAVANPPEVTAAMRSAMAGAIVRDVSALKR